MSDEHDPIPDDELPLESEQDSAVDPKQRKRKEVQKKLTERDLDRFVGAQVFDQEVGRKFIWGLLVAAGTFEERFACGPNGFPQPEHTWFLAGQQAWGQRLYQTWLMRFPEQVRLMHLENDTRFQPQKAS